MTEMQQLVELAEMQLLCKSVMRLGDADGMAKSVEPDQTAPGRAV